MKFFTVILAFYFFTLNVYPCGDSDSHKDCSVEIEMNTDTDDQHEDHNHTEECSPFCHCHCCHVHTIQVTFIGYPILKPDYSNTVFGVFEGVSEEATLVLLQPPQFIG